MESLPKHPKQAEILVYSKSYCPYCVAAMNLLTQKGVAFSVVDVTSDREAYEKMLKIAAPRRTVPQIIVDNVCLGGFDDIKALDDEEKLETLLFPKGRN